MLISLIGLPGGGKSSVGRQLAKRLKVAFIDSDAVIERELQETIRRFFDREGESRFRDVEERIIDRLTREHQGVLATGGGCVLRESNRRVLADRSTVIYLQSSPDDLFLRLHRDTQRPLLQMTDPLARLRQLHDERDSLYREIADFVVETGRPSITALVNKIAMRLDLSPPQAASPPGN